MKKQMTSLFLMFALCTVLLSACGQKAPTWQEQYDLGVRHLSEGNYEEAIIAFTAAIEIDPKQSDAYIGLCDVYVAMGDTDKALEVLSDGLSKTGSNVIQSRIDELEQSASASKIRQAQGDTAQILADLIDFYLAEDMDGMKNLMRQVKCQDISNDLGQGQCVLFEDGNIAAAAYPNYYFYFGEWVDGHRSGQGLWIRAYYDDDNTKDCYWYLGTWANDLPNGSGTVREIIGPAKINRQPNKSYNVDVTSTGAFQNGLFHGTFNVTWLMEDGESKIWKPISAVNGIYQPRADIPAEVLERDYYQQKVAQGQYIVSFDQTGSDLWSRADLVHKVHGIFDLSQNEVT